ncbi:CHAD domain-containing protein [Paraburkholderia panacisoli]|uniref:CHAD domain-containing protein n=1 Tax=Paraburkholderia panacisoli TaxID=2603818 RepID=UPI00165F1849|nr:CHAD domain-containing protein [Paraburkholderia panacisoli]
MTSASTVADAFSLLATSTAGEAMCRVRKLDAQADPEVLHKLRVALRRLRSLWWAYEPLLDRKEAKIQCREFKALAAAAGRTRDWDVLHDLLSTANQSTKHSFPLLIQSVAEHRTDALSFSVRTIGNAGVGRILNHAVAGARQQLDAVAVRHPLATFAGQRAKLAEKALSKRVKRVASASHADYASLHEVRIAGKKLRYVLEFFAPVLDGNHRPLIERLTSVQNDLGVLNDLVTSEALLREYASQLGEAELVNEAVWYLHVQKVHRMNHVHQILRAAE